MASDSWNGRTTADDVLRGVDLSGQTILVTGANSGIGFETARALSAHGARVFLACRNPEAGAQSVAAIAGQHPGANVQAVTLDLASFQSVRRVAAELPVDRLDAVICNAGLYTQQYAATADGIESTVGVCHFGHFLLVLSLMPHLLAAGAAPGRVVMVASESHRYPRELKFERFPLDPERYRALIAYGQAKLCNVLFANEFTRRYAARGLYANSLHPGSMIGTNIFRNSIPAKVLALALRPFTKTLAQGAATSVYCATSPALAGVGGRYYVDCNEKAPSRGARDLEAARKLWELSVERVGLP